MLKSFLDFLEGRATAGRPPDPRTLELATAALLVEVVHAARDVQPAEQEALRRAVHEKFGLDAAQADALLQDAEERMRQASDYYQYTSLINANFTQEQKQQVIEQMWRVAYADDVLSAQEQHLIRKIAGLLHVPDGEYIAAKLRAKEDSARSRSGMPERT
jgi:uncharacterized tellurite resistance protein B-like protein